MLVGPGLLLTFTVCSCGAVCLGGCSAAGTALYVPSAMSLAAFSSVTTIWTPFCGFA
jgi:hypothetical protein